MIQSLGSSGDIVAAPTVNIAFTKILRDPLLLRAGAWLGGYFRRHPHAFIEPPFDGAGLQERLTDIPIPDWPYPPDEKHGREVLELFVSAGLLTRDAEGRYHPTSRSAGLLSAFSLYSYRNVERITDRFPGVAAAAIGHRVLEAGCGAGAYALYFRDLGAAMVIALDCGCEQVNLTRRFAAATGGGVAIVRGSVEYLPLPDASVDFIHCRVVLPYVHLQRTIGEFARVLSPGGQVLLMLHSASFYRWQLGQAGLRPRYASEITLAFLGLAGGTAFSLLGWEPQWSTGKGRFRLSYQPRRAFSRLVISHGFRIERWDANGRKPIVWLSKAESTFPETA